MRLLLLLKIMLVFLLFSACGVGNGIDGEGTVITKNYTLEDISGLEMSIPGKINIRQGEVQQVEVTGQANILELLDMDVTRKGVCEIEFEKNIGNHKPIMINMVVNSLDKVQVLGSGDIEASAAFTGTEELDITITGSGDIAMMGNFPQVNTQISGSGNIKLEGQAEKLESEIIGSGDLNALLCLVEDADIHISGSGDCKVWVEDRLNVSIVGSGDVLYKGDPKIDLSVVGSGTAKKIK